MGRAAGMRERWERRQRESRLRTKRALLLAAFLVALCGGAILFVPLPSSRAATAVVVLAYGLVVSAIVLLVNRVVKRNGRDTPHEGGARRAKSALRELLEATWLFTLLMLVGLAFRSDSLSWNIARAVLAVMFWGMIVVPLVDRLCARRAS